VRALGRWLLAALVLLVGRARPHRPAGPGERILPPAEPDKRAETGVLALLAATSLAAVGFVVAYALEAETQILGVALALAFAFLAAAAALASRRLVPQETREEPLGDHVHEEDEREADEIVREGLDGVSRRHLLAVAAGGTVTVLGAALAVPAVSLGPLLDPQRLRLSPWRAGRRLVDEQGRAVAADALEVGSFLTAFPEGISRERLDASVAVVRLRADELALPADRADWSADGIVAYSKICTHAACAVSLFRYPLFDPTSPSPALVCPCHYSTFDPGRAGAVLFGPAGRPLPQLPLAIAADGALVATGGLSAPPGPSWWGVRT
jgi:ubiquinol-cytochrome c reductase iron-sulfur subunit